METKMSTRFEYRKWVQKMKIENEYNPNTNQIGPKGLREERGLLKVCLMLDLALILASKASLKPASNDSYKCHIYRHTTVKKNKNKNKNKRWKFIIIQ